MPAQYEKIRDSLEARGKSAKAAKSEAAATYNARHPKGPFVTGHHEATVTHVKARPSHT